MSCIRTQQLILKPESLAKTISVDLLNRTKIDEVPQQGRVDFRAELHCRKSKIDTDEL